MPVTPDPQEQKAVSPAPATPAKYETGGDVQLSQIQRQTLNAPLILGELNLPSAGTQTTIGAAGSASALPANPKGYLKILLNGTEVAIPYYAPS